MNLREIITTWLRARNFDGLHHDSDCSCSLKDLMPCDHPSASCKPGVSRPDLAPKPTLDWIGPEPSPR